MDPKSDPKDLQDFLKKVDSISSIVSDLNAKDENVRKNALNEADNYLKKVGGKGGGQQVGFSKTQINKIEDVAVAEEQRAETRPEISPEEFMKQVEEDRYD